MTDGSFFSQLYCQAMQKAWKHCGNGEIRPGRHPSQIWESFPKFHENSGHPGCISSQGDVIREIKQNGPTEGLLPPTSSPQNGYQHSNGFMVLNLENIFGGFRGGDIWKTIWSVSFSRHEQHWPCLTCSASFILTGNSTVTIHSVPLSDDASLPVSSLHCCLWKWNDVFDPVMFRNYIIFTPGLLALGQHRQLSWCPRWEHWPEKTYFLLFCGLWPACPHSHLSDGRLPVSNVGRSRSSSREGFEMDSLDHKTTSVTSQRPCTHRVDVAVLRWALRTSSSIFAIQSPERKVRIRYSRWLPLMESLARTQACIWLCCSWSHLSPSFFFLLGWYLTNF